MSHPFHPPRATQPVEGSSHLINAMEAPSPLPNILAGMVTSCREGLTRTTYRIRMGGHTDVRMRWPLLTHSRRTLEIGQMVRLTIPQEAVYLEAGGFRQGKQRWNRWIGRVVLPSHNSETNSTTVKIHQDPITLKSRGPVTGTHARLSTWDTVNIVVDPQQIKVCSCALASNSRPPIPKAPSPLASFQTPSVWLTVTLRACRPSPSGHHLILGVGDTSLIALIDAGYPSTRLWPVGSRLEVNVGSGDAWIRKDAHSPMVSCCIVLSTQFADSPPSEGTRRQVQ